ncbi:hypothetical protein BU26DRAFT_517526, partial [Trematosphaeria pertusa]
MDHIPYPTDLNLAPVVVPYIQTSVFDPEDFDAFETRLRGGDTRLSAREHAGLAQAWLYFGFLEVFVGEKIDKRRFLRRPTAPEAVGVEYVLDSSALPSLLDGCVRRFRKSRREAREKHLQHWSRTLRTAQQHISQLQNACYTGGLEWDETYGAVFLSISILEVTLRDFYFRMDYTWSAKERNWGAYPRAMNKRMPGFKPVLQHGHHDQATPGARLLIKYVRHNTLTCPCFGSSKPPLEALTRWNTFKPRRLLIGKFRRRMKEAAWCPHQTGLFLDTTDYVVGYYLSSIPRKEEATHERCTEERCIAYNTDNATYVTKHFKSRCECCTVEASDHALNGIVATNGIPLIRIKKEPSGQYLLGVVECKPDTEYTAISHVWIDGLGNPKANGLPNCQIEKLAEHLLQLERSQESLVLRLWRAVWRRRSKTPLVWMDTLCIPVKPEHKHLREKAINGMSLIYAGAKQVLILDDELRRIDSRNEPIQLLHARMLASKWNSRSWTLQEGALAQKVYFQFRGSAVPLEFPEQPYLRSFLRLFWRALKSPRWFLTFIHEYSTNLRRNWSWPSFFKNPAPSGYQTMTHYVQRSFHVLASTHFDLQITSEVIRLSGWSIRFFTTQTSFGSLRHKLERTWNMLGQRTTTYAEDLHVVIANLAGFSVSQIMGLATPDQRTKTILHRIGAFNVGLLCNRYLRPLAAEDSADRWIPSFPAPDQLEGNLTLVVEERGMTFHPDTKQGDVRAFLIHNSASMESFWIKSSRPCQDSNCSCHNNEDGTEDPNDQPQHNQPQDGLLDNAEDAHTGQGQEPLEACLQEQHRSDAIEPVSHASEGSGFSTNSKGEHFIHEWYHITCRLPENDKLERSRYQDNKACILLIPPLLNGPKTRLQGARLLETGRSEADAKVHLRYDCPLEYSIHSLTPSHDTLGGAPVLFIMQEVSHNDILIECQTDPNIRTKYFTRDGSFFMRSPYGIMGILGLLLFIILMGAIVLFVFAVLQGTSLRKYSVAVRWAGDIACSTVIIIMTVLLYKMVLRWTRIQAFRAWKKTLED